LPAFTGITNDYEPPVDCELVLDTAAPSVSEAAETIERMLLATGVLFDEVIDLAANI
jgi:bifunctional enzyme CysN/CysC